MNGFKAPYMVCPSSPLTEFLTPATGTQILAGSYVLIEGGSNYSNVISNDHGERSMGGAFLRNRSIRFRDMTDGSSNTMMIGEQSNWGKNSTQQPVELRASSGVGSWMSPENIAGASGNPARCFNTTTVRYPMGTINSTLANVLPQQCNTPLQSAHVGGGHILLGDGAVRFISDSINITTLRNLANRDDGQVLGEF